MNTKIYIVMIKDRHCDPGAKVFTNPDKAIEYAKDTSKELCRFPEDFKEGLTDSMVRAGWLYHAEYSCEGDSVWVVPSELDPLIDRA